MTTAETPFDPLASLSRLRTVTAVTIAVCALASLFWGLSHLLGVVAGGLIAMVNVGAIGRFVVNLGSERPPKLSFLSSFGLLFRYILLCLALFVIIGVWHANVAAVAIGFSAPVVAVFVECGFTYRESKPEREPRQ